MSKYTKPSWTDKLPPVYLPYLTLVLTTPQMYLLHIPLPLYLALLSLILSISLAIPLTIKALTKWQKLQPLIIAPITIIITLATGAALLATTSEIIFSYSTTILQILAITLTAAISCIDILSNQTGLKSILLPTKTQSTKNTQHLFLFLYLPFTTLLTLLSHQDMQNRIPNDPEQRRMKQFYNFVNKDARPLKN